MDGVYSERRGSVHILGQEVPGILENLPVLCHLLALNREIRCKIG